MDHILKASVKVKAGKISNHILQNLLETLPTRAGSHVEQGPAIGEDCAILNINGRMILVASDPITFPTENPGWHSVIINSNDIAASGGTPKWYTSTILIPEHTEEIDYTNIFNEIAHTCLSMDIELIGGHSEITHSVKYPIVSGTMIGTAEASEIKRTNNAQEGDDIFITKYSPIEAIQIIMSQFPNALLQSGLDTSDIEYLGKIAGRDNLSILQDSKIARRFLEVHSMHDPTEGGVSTGLYELVSSSHVGAVIQESDLPIPDQWYKACEMMNVNPLGLVASGSLLFTADPKAKQDIIDEFNRHSIKCSHIGKVTSEFTGISLVTRDSADKIPLPFFERDEITKLI